MKLQFTNSILSIQRESYPAVCAALHAIYVRRRAAWRDAHPQHDHKAQSERGEG